MPLNQDQVNELLYQALEVEIGGQQIYKQAIECAANDDVREEWQKYLSETENHEVVLRDLFAKLNLDPETDSPGREVARLKATALVEAMQFALKSVGKEGAQLVAAESVVEAETKDHQNWELIGRVADAMKGDAAKALHEAYEEVEEEEDEHLYHTMGWARELWIESLGMDAVLPPPEEQKSVTTAIGASRAEQGREALI